MGNRPEGLIRKVEEREEEEEEKKGITDNGWSFSLRFFCGGIKIPRRKTQHVTECC
jgi:hypothetical protein